MDFSTLCPGCKRKHVYFSHEVGGEAQCRGCGTAIPLPRKDAVVAGRIVWIVVVGLVAGVLLILRFSRIGGLLEDVGRPVPGDRRAP